MFLYNGSSAPTSPFKRYGNTATPTHIFNQAHRALTDAEFGDGQHDVPVIVDGCGRDLVESLRPRRRRRPVVAAV